VLAACLVVVASPLTAGCAPSCTVVQGVGVYCTPA